MHDLGISRDWSLLRFLVRKKMSKQMEQGDHLACFALARGHAAGRFLLVSELHIRGLDEFQRRFIAEELALRRIAEDSVTLNLCDRQRRCKIADDKLHDIAENCLGMIQLAPDHKGSEPGNVGEEKIAPSTGESTADFI